MAMASVWCSYALVFVVICLAGLYHTFFYLSLRSILQSRTPAAVESEHHLHLHSDKKQFLKDSDFKNSVTPMVHQSWKSRQLPTNRSRRWSGTWKTCFPDWEWRLWTDEDNLALVRDHYPSFLPVYLRLKIPVERADLARYFYMFHYGGIYTDLDNVCVRNFEHLLASAALIFGGMDGVKDRDPVLHTYVQNSFMASRPRHPFWMRLIRRVMMYQRSAQKGRPEHLTGPYVLMDELRNYMRSDSSSDVKIYESKYFNPYSWFTSKLAVCKNLGRMTDADEKACVAAFPEAYVVQFHTQSWLEGRM